VLQFGDDSRRATHQGEPAGRDHFLVDPDLTRLRMKVIINHVDASPFEDKPAEEEAAP
jgi:hypothetical protein